MTRAKLIRPDSSLKELGSGLACEEFGTDTAYFCATDSEGNACSFINSNFMGFGTGIVPEGCGFTLQNRGANFSLDKNHPNCIAPGKRPYHTIIPAMLTTTPCDGSVEADLLAVMGVMGGFMQPQGHVQVLLNMVLFGMNPQEALNAPRFCIGPGHEGPVGSISLEEGIASHILDELRRLGHDVQGPVSGFDRTLFGRGHVIQVENFASGLEKDDADCADGFRARTHCDRIFLVGCEPRSDGRPYGY